MKQWAAGNEAGEEGSREGSRRGRGVKERQKREEGRGEDGKR